MKKVLHNLLSKEELKQRLAGETFRRTTLSFYRYVILDDASQFRDNLYQEMNLLGVLGRIYLAKEGINAQISIPEHNMKLLRELVDSIPQLNNVPFKIAVEDDGKSFYKLIIRIKSKIVADGLNDDLFDVTNVGKHLSAKEFNEALHDPKTIVIDMRNHYESEVGKFKGALVPDTDTFRETLPVALDMVKDKKDNKILLYCTGGIRCEKASAYFRHQGFTDVNQLLGGIIDYARQVKAEGLETEFIGKNFVFDDRLGERITGDIISVCHQCGQPSDDHTNCANDDCHLLFIQCAACRDKYHNCCSETCSAIAALPFEEQVTLRRGRVKHDTLSVYKKSRVRPRLDGMTLEKR
ncbi:MAG TPA: rhodanese-related sulfurtransferase [Bacteroidia bacterium]|nr:rhodanese-related sulfurtransferase [Bacteroidia bacterium]